MNSLEWSGRRNGAVEWTTGLEYWSTGVAGIWGPPDYGDPRPNITSDIGTGVTIFLSDI